MKAWKKVLVGTLVALILVAVLAPATLAAQEEGCGWIVARGSGEAILDGDGTVTIHGRGAAVVWVTGAEQLRAWGLGHRVDLPDGTVRFDGWWGTIRASGDEMHIRMVGSIISFYARGCGSVFLRGSGWYRTGQGSGVWSSEGVTIELN